MEFHSTSRYAPRILFVIALAWFLLVDFITNSSWRGVRVSGKQHWCWFLQGLQGASGGSWLVCGLLACMGLLRWWQQEGLTGKALLLLGRPYCPVWAQQGVTGSPGQHALRDPQEGAGWQAGAASCSGTSWKKGVVFARQPPCHV